MHHTHTHQLPPAPLLERLHFGAEPSGDVGGSNIAVKSVMFPSAPESPGNTWSATEEGCIAPVDPLVCHCPSRHPPTACHPHLLHWPALDPAMAPSHNGFAPPPDSAAVCPSVPVVGKRNLPISLASGLPRNNWWATVRTGCWTFDLISRRAFYVLKPLVLANLSLGRGQIQVFLKTNCSMCNNDTISTTIMVSYCPRKVIFNEQPPYILYHLITN